MIKFAKYSSTEKKMEHSFDLVRDLVEVTRIQPHSHEREAETSLKTPEQKVA